jgi:predicted XRE-type DNA-binding protein
MKKTKMEVTKNTSVSTNEEVLKILKIVERESKRGNIAQALPFDATYEKKIKWALCGLFVRYMIKSNISLTRLSLILEIPKTRMSDFKNYKLERYTIDKILFYVNKLAEIDPPTREHLNLMLIVLRSPVRSVKDSKKLEKELMK